MKKTEEIKQTIKKDIEKEVPVEFLNSGSTMLNLALSGKGKEGGWARNRICNIPALGSAGKSLAALEACAVFYYNMKGNESVNFPKVENPIVVYNNPESVMDFPINNMYGEEFVKGITWKNIPTVEETGRDISNHIIDLKEGDSLLYVIDSWDALKSENNLDEFMKSAEKNEKGKTGFNLDKQKYGTQQFFPNICTLMNGKDATLMIISQVRANIGVSFGPKFIRTGGSALDFYTHQVAWLKQIKKQTKVFRGREKVFSVKVEVDVKRNKVALPYRKAEFDILFNHGFDDISSMLSWYFGPNKKLTTEQIDIFSVKYDKEKTNRSDIVSFIEDNNLESELQEIVEKEWNEVEEAIKPKRKKKFGGKK